MPDQKKASQEIRTAVIITRQFCDISYGGVEVHVLNLARQYLRMGLNVKVIRIGTQPSISKLEEEFEFTFLQFGKSQGQIQSHSGSNGMLGEIIDRILMNAYTTQQFQELLEAIGEADFVHFHDLLAVTRISRKLAKTNHLVWTNHLGEFLKISRLPFGSRLLKILTKPYKVAIAPSSELANQGCISPRVFQIPNGFDKNLFTFSKDKLKFKKKLNLPLNKRVYLVPRRWAPTKGVHNLVKALKSIDDPNCIFVFLGYNHGGYDSYFESVLRDLLEWRIEYKLIDSVSSDKMSYWLGASEYTVIPSLEEATSLSALEAMSSGSLVMCTPIGGLLELIQNGKTGLMSLDTSPDSLEALFFESIKIDSAQRYEMAEKARDFVEQNYTWETIATRTLKVIEENLKSKV